MYNRTLFPSQFGAWDIYIDDRCVATVYGRKSYAERYAQFWYGSSVSVQVVMAENWGF